MIRESWEGSTTCTAPHCRAKYSHQRHRQVKESRQDKDSSVRQHALVPYRLCNGRHKPQGQQPQLQAFNGQSPVSTGQKQAPTSHLFFTFGVPFNKSKTSYLCKGVHGPQHMCESQMTVWEFALSLYHVGSGNRAWQQAPLPTVPYHWPMVPFFITHIAGLLLVLYFLNIVYFSYSPSQTHLFLFHDKNK